MDVSILGCGWLGLPLAISLIGKGHSVRGSTRDTEKLSELQSAGIRSFFLDLSPGLICDDPEGFFDADILVINIPPARRDDITEFHKKQIESIINAIEKSRIEKVIFISSTSVYPELNREVFEDETAEPDKNSGKALKIVENMLLNAPGFRTTVLRLAGLIGYDRNPRNFLKKRRVIHKINTPVNLVHRDDCISVIEEIIKKDIWGEIFNVCCDNHPKRIDFYKKEASLAGLELEDPEKTEYSDFKLVSNKKVKERLNYSFKYPDPLSME